MQGLKDQSTIHWVNLRQRREARSGIRELPRRGHVRQIQKVHTKALITAINANDIEVKIDDYFHQESVLINHQQLFHAGYQPHTLVQNDYIFTEIQYQEMKPTNQIISVTPVKSKAAQLNKKQRPQKDTSTNALERLNSIFSQKK